MANALDREASQAGSENDASVNERAYATYQRVVTLLEKSATPLSESKNLQVAYSRLAHYAAQLGKHAEAAEQLEKLLKINPQDRRLLRRAGRLTQPPANTHRPSSTGARYCWDCPKEPTTGWKPSTSSCNPCPTPTRTRRGKSCSSSNCSIRTWAAPRGGRSSPN